MVKAEGSSRVNVSKSQIGKTYTSTGQRIATVSGSSRRKVIDVQGSGKITYETDQQKDARLNAVASLQRGEQPKQYVSVSGSGYTRVDEEAPAARTNQDLVNEERQRLIAKYGKDAEPYIRTGQLGTTDERSGILGQMQTRGEEAKKVELEKYKSYTGPKAQDVLIESKGLMTSVSTSGIPERKSDYLGIDRVLGVVDRSGNIIGMSDEYKNRSDLVIEGIPDSGDGIIGVIGKRKSNRVLLKGDNQAYFIKPEGFSKEEVWKQGGVTSGQGVLPPGQQRKLIMSEYRGDLVKVNDKTGKYTEIRPVDFGGGMGGELKTGKGYDEKIINSGADRLFENAAVRRESGRLGTSYTPSKITIKGEFSKDISQQNKEEIVKSILEAPVSSEITLTTTTSKKEEVSIFNQKSGLEQSVNSNSYYSPVFTSETGVEQSIMESKSKDVNVETYTKPGQYSLFGIGLGGNLMLPTGPKTSLEVPYSGVYPVSMLLGGIQGGYSASQKGYGLVKTSAAIGGGVGVGIASTVVATVASMTVEPVMKSYFNVVNDVSSKMPEGMGKEIFTSYTKYPILGPAGPYVYFGLKEGFRSVVPKLAGVTESESSEYFRSTLKPGAGAEQFNIELGKASVFIAAYGQTWGSGNALVEKGLNYKPTINLKKSDNLGSGGSGGSKSSTSSITFGEVKNAIREDVINLKDTVKNNFLKPKSNPIVEDKVLGIKVNKVSKPSFYEEAKIAAVKDYNNLKLDFNKKVSKVSNFFIEPKKTALDIGKVKYSEYGSDYVPSDRPVLQYEDGKSLFVKKPIAATIKPVKVIPNKAKFKFKDEYIDTTDKTLPQNIRDFRKQYKTNPKNDINDPSFKIITDDYFKKVNKEDLPPKSSGKSSSNQQQILLEKPKNTGVRKLSSSADSVGLPMDLPVMKPKFNQPTGFRLDLGKYFYQPQKVSHISASVLDTKYKNSQAVKNIQISQQLPKQESIQVSGQKQLQVQVQNQKLMVSPVLLSGLGSVGAVGLYQRQMGEQKQDSYVYNIYQRNDIPVGGGYFKNKWDDFFGSTSRGRGRKKQWTGALIPEFGDLFGVYGRKKRKSKKRR